MQRVPSSLGIRALTEAVFFEAAVSYEGGDPGPLLRAAVAYCAARDTCPDRRPDVGAIVSRVALALHSPEAREVVSAALAYREVPAEEADEVYDLARKGLIGAARRLASMLALPGVLP